MEIFKLTIDNDAGTATTLHMSKDDALKTLYQYMEMRIEEGIEADCFTKDQVPDFGGGNWSVALEYIDENAYAEITTEELPVVPVNIVHDALDAILDDDDAECSQRTGDMILDVQNMISNYSTKI